MHSSAQDTGFPIADPATILLDAPTAVGMANFPVPPLLVIMVGVSGDQAVEASFAENYSDFLKNTRNTAI